MDDIIPYSLRAGEVDSTGYYRTIGDFTGFWLRRADEIAGPTIGAFQGFQMNSGKPARTLLELSFEGLALGVQLREHAGQARQQIWALSLQRALLDFQNRYPQSEQVFKAIRGLVNGLV